MRHFKTTSAQKQNCWTLAHKYFFGQHLGVKCSIETKGAEEAVGAAAFGNCVLFG